MKGFNINNPMEIISYKMMSYKNGYLYSVESHLLRLAIESLKKHKGRYIIPKYAHENWHYDLH